jgi:hypothetical protein
MPRLNEIIDAHRYTSYDEPEPEPEPLPVKPSIKSQGRVPSSSRLEATRYDSRSESPVRAGFGRSTTFQGPTSIHRESSNNRQNSIPNNIGTLKNQLRQTNRINTNHPDVFCDPSDESNISSASPDCSYRTRSVSPATSQGSTGSTTANGKRAPPPPPPSRAKKPPPPPPMKRAEISSGNVIRY